MLKLLFWTLLLANGALLAYQQGYLNTLFPDGREPGRAAKQFNADKIKPVTAVSAASASTTPVVAEPVVAANALDRKLESVTCTEIGNFDAPEAKRFEARLASLNLGARLSQRAVQEPSRHMVYIPSQGSKEGADKKAGELRLFGVKDFYVIQESTDLRWGISLGVFKTEESARAHLTSLNQKGVRSARLGQYSAPVNKLAFQLRGLDASAKNNLEKIRADFPRLEARGCDAVQ